MMIRSCVAPTGTFVYGIHKPAFQVANHRRFDPSCVLGYAEDGQPVDNQVNLPSGTVAEPAADWIYEVPNPFAFRGSTFIVKHWADQRAAAPEKIGRASLPEVSLHETASNLPPGRSTRAASSNTRPGSRV